MGGVLLSEINDRKLLERVIGWEVYGADGKAVGRLYKVFISKKTKQPLKAVVKKLSGGYLEVQPERLRVEKGRLRLLNADQEAFFSAVKRLEEITSELKRLRESILLLDEQLISGSISREVFWDKRRRIDERRIILKLEAHQLLEALQFYVEQHNIELTDDDRKRIAHLLDLLSLDLPVLPVSKILRLFGQELSPSAGGG